MNDLIWLYLTFFSKNMALELRLSIVQKGSYMTLQLPPWDIRRFALMDHQTGFERCPVVQEKISVDAINAMLEDAAQGHELHLPVSTSHDIHQPSIVFIYTSNTLPLQSQNVRDMESERREFSQLTVATEKSRRWEVGSLGATVKLPLSSLIESWDVGLFCVHFWKLPLHRRDTCSYKVHWHWIFPEMADDGLHRRVGMWRENIKTVRVLLKATWILRSKEIESDITWRSSPEKTPIPAQHARNSFLVQWNPDVSRPLISFSLSFASLDKRLWMNCIWRSCRHRRHLVLGGILRQVPNLEGWDFAKTSNIPIFAGKNMWRESGEWRDKIGNHGNLWKSFNQ